jgi:hypothetical protein
MASANSTATFSYVGKENLVTRPGHAIYGRSLPTYKYAVSGNLVKEELVANKITVEATADNSKYTTDFAKVYIPVPVGSTKYGYSDGILNPSDTITLSETATLDSNGRIETVAGVKYLVLNMQYVLGDADGSVDSWGICGNTTYKNGVVYLHFENETDNLVDGELVFMFDFAGLTFSNQQQ